MSSAVSLDQFDLKMLAHLEREGRCSNVELADAVGLSQSPCLVRTKRLQQVGIIRGYRADIALEKSAGAATIC
jgi:DNA-binding Lrp family transcriptional regulator